MCLWKIKKNSIKINENCYKQTFFKFDKFTMLKNISFNMKVTGNFTYKTRKCLNKQTKQKAFESCDRKL